MVASRELVGRSFLTRFDLDGDPVWAPIERVARLARRSAELPSFHEAEFMCMGAVHHDRTRVTIHLYKHRDTRKYLNLDDAGHAYAYRYVESDPHGEMSGGRYRRYGNLVAALEAVDLWLFVEEPRCFRSFPPEAWPASDRRESGSRGDEDSGHARRGVATVGDQEAAVGDRRRRRGAARPSGAHAQRSARRRAHQPG